MKTLDARELMNQIADAAWRCADPGVQYDTIINRWHTCPESGRINASNPCSEYMHVDDSACNLASLNLMKFRRDDGSFDVEDFEHAVDIVFLAQEIVVGFSSYPTEEITENANRFRQLGLGYANLGALLMSDGLPYDSDAGRNVAAAITALMTGRAYRQSALIAAGATGPYDEYEKNRDAHNGVMRMHRDASYDVDPTGIKGELLEAAQRAWDEAVELGEEHGYRNAQATVLAPTGTISFLMDCDTTGIEPDFSLVKFKELVGGGQMTIVNRSVPLALRTLGYAEPQVEQIAAYITENSTIVGAPGLKDEHLPVFDVAVGERAISHTGHIDMMAATQPFISGRDLEDGQPAADGDDRGHRRRLHARLEGRPQGAGDLPRRLEDGAGAAHRRPGGKGGRGRGRRAAAGAQADAARARVDHPQVLDRRPRGLHHRRQVRGRHRRRDLPHRHRQGGLDDARAAQRLRHGDLDSASSTACRSKTSCASSATCASSRRASPATRRSPSPSRCPTTSCAGSASRFIDDTDTLEDLGILTQEVRAKQDAETTQLGLGIDTSGGTAGPGQRRRQRQRPKPAPACGGLHRNPPGGPGQDVRPRPRPRLRAVRRHDAAHGLLLHVLQLRQQHRLRLRP